MKLYRKQLNSVKELRREQRRLKRSMAESEKKSQDNTSGDPTNPFGTATDLFGGLLGAKGVPDVLAGIAMPILRLAIVKAQKGILKKVAKEVLGGYLKWKAIDAGINLAARFLRRQKHRADREHAERANAHGGPL